MIRLICVLFAWALHNQGLASSRNIIPFIVNGNEASVASLPHQLQLQMKLNLRWKFICGAVIIREVYALTAAHCVEDAEPIKLRVVAGLHSKNDNNFTQTSRVETITTHRNHSDGQAFLSNDVAILRLSTPLRFDKNVQPIPWNRNPNETFEGHVCTLSGWGETHDSYTSDVLQKVDMRIVSNAKCAELLSGIPSATIYQGHICAFDPPRGSCGGDSGGPMTCSLENKPMLAGVTSWNIRSGGDCSTKHPSVYSRLSFFATWIDENTP